MNEALIILLGVSIGAGCLGLGVFLGGIFVYKAKTIAMPTPFIQPKKQINKGKSQSYVQDLYSKDNLADMVSDETLSPASARLRAQKLDKDVKYEYQSIMNLVRGKKA